MTMFGIANGDYGDEIVINGSGPENFSTNINIMGAANVPPYLLVLSNQTARMNTQPLVV